MIIPLYRKKGMGYKGIVRRHKRRDLQNITKEDGYFFLKEGKTDRLTARRL